MSTTANAADQQPLSLQEKISQMETKYDGWRSKFPGVNSIKADRLKEMIEKDNAGKSTRPLVLVDVRTVGETNISVIASKNTLLKAEFEARMDEFKDHDVVCYCTAGYRSGMFCNEALSRGFPAARLFNLEGSILSASHYGLPLMVRVGGKNVDGSFQTEPTDRVHVWGASLLPLLGEGYSPFLPPPTLSASVLDKLFSAWTCVLVWLQRFRRALGLP